jgi:hypothetical protein
MNATNHVMAGRASAINNTVIASAAKQSILPLPSDGLLRRFAPRNDHHLEL